MTPPSIAAVLSGAADLVERGWTQGVFARTAAGHVISPYSEDATCFCARGAIVRVGNFSLTAELSNIQSALGFSNAAALARWNDMEGRTQAEVVARLRNRAAILAAADAGEGA